MTGSADGLATRLLERWRVRPVPPVDVVQLALQMGVRGISDADLIEDGRLEISSEEVRIVVRRGLGSSRRRFTIAHELAHLLLADKSMDLVARRALPVAGTEERFCDQLAAAVLMPRAWVEAHYANKPRSLSTIRQLSRQTGTSLAAALVRLNEIAGWKMSLLRWKLSGGRWRFVASAGVPAPLHGHLSSMPLTLRSLELIGRRTPTDIWTNLPIGIYGGVAEVDAQVSVQAGSALALTALANLPILKAPR